MNIVKPSYNETSLRSTRQIVDLYDPDLVIAAVPDALLIALP